MRLLTPNQVAAAVVPHFSDIGVSAEITMTAICFAESGVVDPQTGKLEGCNPAAEFDNAAHLNPATGKPWEPEGSPAQYDDGLAQINSQHGYDRARLRSDVNYNLSCARDIFNARQAESGDGFDAWSTYNSGAYLRWMPEAGTAIATLHVPPLSSGAPLVPAGFLAPGGPLVQIEDYARTRGIAGEGVSIEDQGDQYVVTVRKPHPAPAG